MVTTLSGWLSRSSLLIIGHLCIGFPVDGRVRVLETMIGRVIVALLLDMKWQLLVTDWMTVNRLSDAGAIFWPGFIVVGHVHEGADK
jgi:hypothetical protein